jgi:hypothetical protein
MTEPARVERRASKSLCFFKERMVLERFSLRLLWLGFSRG